MTCADGGTLGVALVLEAISADDGRRSDVDVLSVVLLRRAVASDWLFRSWIVLQTQILCVCAEVVVSVHCECTASSRPSNVEE